MSKLPNLRNKYNGVHPRKPYFTMAKVSCLVIIHAIEIIYQSGNEKLKVFDNHKLFSPQCSDIRIKETLKIPWNRQNPLHPPTFYKYTYLSPLNTNLWNARQKIKK